MSDLTETRITAIKDENGNEYACITKSSTDGEDWSIQIVPNLLGSCNIDINTKVSKFKF